MGRKILVVDDDAMNLKMAEFILKQKNYEVIKAASGLECLQILQAQEVDLILLDIEMPMMNGMVTLEKIRNKKELAEVPVIFLTASADEDTVREAGKLGADGYIKKPFFPQDLLERVEKTIDMQNK